MRVVRAISQKTRCKNIVRTIHSDDILSFSHGNNCAGLIAAIQGNMVCSSGVAPNAKIAGLMF